MTDDGDKRMDPPAEAADTGAAQEVDESPEQEQEAPEVTTESNVAIEEQAAESSPAEEQPEPEVVVESTDEDVVDEDISEPASTAGSPAVSPTGPVEIDIPEEEEIVLNWYILKVQSNRERSISEALRRKIAIEGIEHLFGQVLVPTEKVTEFKGGKKKVVERKLWPGYIAVEMHVNDDTWFAIRETSGIGDFTGAGGKPTPMQQSEIDLILHKDVEETDEAPKLDIKFTPGDKVKVMEGNFENFEGEVSEIDETHGRVTVMLSIFGRPTPVELEYWQVEAL